MNKKNNNLEDFPHLDSEDPKKKKIDVHSTKSEKKGLPGQLESIVRRFKQFGFIVVMAPVAIVYVLSIGLAITPGYMVVITTLAWADSFVFPLQALTVSISIAIAYLLYGITLILVVPLFDKMNPFKIKPWRGNWYSLQTVPWYYHNALVQLVRYTFLDFVTPTPLNIFFYRGMGMKIGNNCIINTTNISDPCLIELEDNVTIGGSATIFGHYAQGGFLIIAPVKIKKGATIGLKASIMGDVIVGEKVVVKPHEILLPKTRLSKHKLGNQDLD